MRRIMVDIRDPGRLFRADLELWTTLYRITYSETRYSDIQQNYTFLLEDLI